MENLNFYKREDILRECDKAIEMSETLLRDDSKHIIIQKVTENISNRVKVIKSICEIEKYKLYFNGEVSIGKSTAISHLIGLINFDNLETGKTINNLPLLKVAGGRTTVCETIIVGTDEQSRITLERMPDDEFKKYISEFCESIFDETLTIPTEIGRVICNMSKFPNENGQVCRDKKIIDEYVRSTHLTDFQYSKETLIEVIWENISYDNRTLTQFLFQKGKYEEWLRDTITQINDGIFERAPFPTKVTIHVNVTDLKLNIPEYISAVIDTRGIEIGVREDITDAINNLGNISVMCDGIGAIGGNESLQKILKHVLLSGEKDLFHRILLLGIEKEPVFLKDANGANGDSNKGSEIKRNEAVQKMNENKIDIGRDNIIFYEPLAGIEFSSKKRNITDIDKKIYNEAKNNFWNALELQLKKMYATYYDEILELIQNLNKLENNQLTPIIIEKFERCRQYVDRACEEIKKIQIGFLEKIKKEMSLYYAAVIRGSINRNGKYYNLDVYAESSVIGGNEFKIKCENEKNTLIRQIESLFDVNDDIEKICISALIQDINVKFKCYYERNCEHYKTCVHTCIWNSTVWEKLRNYWGDGQRNYKNRVISEIEDELIRNSINEELMKQDFYTAYMRDIESFLII